MHYSRRREFLFLLVLASYYSTQVLAAGPDAKSLANAAFVKSKTAQSIDDYKTVIQLCEQALTAGPDEATAKYARDLAAWGYNRRGEQYASAAQRLVAAGKANEAQDMEAAALDDFNQSLEFDAARWKAYHNRGVSLAAEGKYKEALADFNKALALHTEYAPSWYNRGAIYVEMQQYAAAERDFTQATKLDPNDAEGYVGRGRALAGANKFREAMADYERAAALNPNVTGIDVDRAEAYSGLGHPEQAAPLFKRAIENEKTARAYRSAAWFMSTCSDPRFVDAELAVKCAEKAVALEGNHDYRYQHTLAAAFLAANRPSDAREAFKKAQVLAPKEQAAAIERQLEQLESDAK